MFSCLSNHLLSSESCQWWAMKGLFYFLILIFILLFYFVLFWLRGWWFDKNARLLTSSPWSMDEMTASGMCLQTHECERSLWTCLCLTSISLSYHTVEKLEVTFSESVLVTFSCFCDKIPDIAQGAELITLVYGFRGFSSGPLGPNPMAAVGAHGQEQLLTSWRTGSREHNRRDQGHDILMDFPHSRHGLLPSSWPHILRFPELHCYQIESKHLTNEPMQDISY